MRCEVWVPQAVDLAGAPGDRLDGAGQGSAVFVALRPCCRFTFRPPPLPDHPPVEGLDRRRAVGDLAAALLAARGGGAPLPPGLGSAEVEAALAAVAAADLALPGPPLTPEERCATAARLLAARGARCAGLPGPLWGRYLGGVTWVRYDLGGWRAERVPLPRAALSRLADALLLVQVPAGPPAAPGAPGTANRNGAGPPVRPDGPDPARVRSDSAAVAALMAGDWEALASALDGDGGGAAPPDPLAAALPVAARAAGARAVRFSRWAPGVLLVLVPPARRGEVARTVRDAGGQPLPLRPTADGLRLAW